MFESICITFVNWSIITGGYCSFIYAALYFNRSHATDIFQSRVFNLIWFLVELWIKSIQFLQKNPKYISVVRLLHACSNVDMAQCLYLFHLLLWLLLITWKHKCPSMHPTHASCLICLPIFHVNGSYMLFDMLRFIFIRIFLLSEYDCEHEWQQRQYSIKNAVFININWEGYDIYFIQEGQPTWIINESLLLFVHIVQLKWAIGNEKYEIINSVCYI